MIRHLPPHSILPQSIEVVVDQQSLELNCWHLKLPELYQPWQRKAWHWHLQFSTDLKSQYTEHLKEEIKQLRPS
jgi:hypothetical protein